MSSVAVVLVIRLVGEAGLFELGVLAAGVAAGTVLEVLLGGGMQPWYEVG